MLVVSDTKPIIALLKAEKLNMLEDYNLSQIWDKNIIGGQP